MLTVGTGFLLVSGVLIIYYIGCRLVYICFKDEQPRLKITPKRAWYEHVCIQVTLFYKEKGFWYCWMTKRTKLLKRERKVLVEQIILLFENFPNESLDRLTDLLQVPLRFKKIDIPRSELKILLSRIRDITDDNYNTEIAYYFSSLKQKFYKI